MKIKTSTCEDLKEWKMASWAKRKKLHNYWQRHILKRPNLNSSSRYSLNGGMITRLDNTN